MFSFLKKNTQDEINLYANSSVYLSSDTEDSNSSVYLSSDTEDENNQCFEEDNEEEDDDEADFEIDFREELSDGTLVFDIVDSDFDKAGHVVCPAKATDKEEIQIIESIFYDAFTQADCNHLKDQVLKFCAVRR